MSPPPDDWTSGGTGWGPLALYTADGRAVAASEPGSDDAAFGEPGEFVFSSGHAAEQWSTTTYSGPRRHRPDRGRSARAVTGAPTDRPLPIVSPVPVGEPEAAEVGALEDLDLLSGEPASTEPTLDPGWDDTNVRQPATLDGPRPAGSADRSLLSSSRTMAIASLASRLTGFLRSIALATALGIAASRVADSYNLANILPNMVYELLLGGVLSSVVIPLIVHSQEHDDDNGDAYTQRLLSWSVVVLGVATLLAVAAAPLLAAAFARGGPQRELISLFATLLLPEIFFYGLGAMFTAVLNTRGVYGPPAWAPVLNNVITIGTVGVFSLIHGPATLTEATITNTQILVLGIGTTLGIAVQAIVLIPFLRRVGFRWKWRFKASSVESVRMSEVSRLASWVLGYVAISQVGVFVINWVANHFKGGPTTFAYADLLFQVPYGVVGVSLLTALMPRMSRSAARNDSAGVVADLSLGARLSAVGLLPFTGGLIVLGPTLTTVLFAYGRSDASDSRYVGEVLAFSAFGLLPFALVMLQLRVFYATRDARTPTLINAFMVATKVVVILVYYYVVGGRSVLIVLAFSTSLSYLVGAIVGHVLLTRRFGRLGFGEVAMTVGRVGGATIGGAGVALVIVLAGRSLLGSGPGGSAVTLLLASLVGGAVLVVLAKIIRVREVDQILASLRRS
ncbi:MAG: Integral rane protein MviN [Pseudonocardiales bacterium]|nr:Integral rane protein MviN [Pseudonocardiales bacterium]